MTLTPHQIHGLQVTQDALSGVIGHIQTILYDLADGKEGGNLPQEWFNLNTLEGELVRAWYRLRNVLWRNSVTDHPPGRGKEPT